MLIKSVRELKRFPHLGGGFTSQYAPVWWEFAKICNDVKSNPHLGPGWGRSGFQLISALCNCSKFPRSLSNEISSCSVILSELPLFSPYFSIKSEYQNTSAFDFFLLQNTVGFENVPLSRIGLRYYSDSVTVILTAQFVSSNVSYVTCSHEHIVTQSCRLVEFTVWKWLTLTQFHHFTPLFDWKKQLCNGKTYKKYEKRAFRL